MVAEVDLQSLAAALVEALNHSDESAGHRTALLLASHAGLDPPLFHAALEALGFHDRLPLINEMAAIAWPTLQENAAYSRPAVQAFAARAADHLIYVYLQGGEQQPASLAGLLGSLENYFPIDAERLCLYLSLLRGEKGRQWTIEDFKPLQMSALSGLLVEFVGFAHRLKMPFTRAHLVRELMPRYLLDRQAGNLQPRVEKAAALRQGQRPFPEAPAPPLHPLAPDRPGLTLFLTRLLQTAYPQSHAAAALLLLTPTWLDFLVYRGLISDEIARQAKALVPLVQADLEHFWANHADRQIRALAAG